MAAAEGGETKANVGGFKLDLGTDKHCFLCLSKTNRLIRTGIAADAAALSEIKLEPPDDDIDSNNDNSSSNGNNSDSEFNNGIGGVGGFGGGGGEAAAAENFLEVLPSPTSVSIKSLCRSLNINMGTIANEFVKLPELVAKITRAASGNLDIKVSLCEVCARTTERFSDFVEELKQIPKEIDKCLHLLHERIITASERDPKLKESYQDLMAVNMSTLLMSGFSDELRKEITRKCSVARYSKADFLVTPSGVLVENVNPMSMSESEPQQGPSTSSQSQQQSSSSNKFAFPTSSSSSQNPPPSMPSTSSASLPSASRNNEFTFPLASDPKVINGGNTAAAAVAGSNNGATTTNKVQKKSKFKCLVCNQGFPSMDALKLHKHDHQSRATSTATPSSDSSSESEEEEEEKQSSNDNDEPQVEQYIYEEEVLEYGAPPPASNSSEDIVETSSTGRRIRRSAKALAYQHVDADFHTTYENFENGDDDDDDEEHLNDVEGEEQQQQQQEHQRRRPGRPPKASSSVKFFSRVSPKILRSDRRRSLRAFGERRPSKKVQHADVKPSAAALVQFKRDPKTSYFNCPAENCRKRFRSRYFCNLHYTKSHNNHNTTTTLTSAAATDNRTTITATTAFKNKSIKPRGRSYTLPATIKCRVPSCKELFKSKTGEYKHCRDFHLNYIRSRRPYKNKPKPPRAIVKKKTSAATATTSASSSTATGMRIKRGPGRPAKRQRQRQKRIVRGPRRSARDKVWRKFPFDKASGRYKCPWRSCEESYGRKWDVLTHYEGRHLKIRHECPTCKGRFSYEKTMRSHQKICKGVAPRKGTGMSRKDNETTTKTTTKKK